MSCMMWVLWGRMGGASKVVVAGWQRWWCCRPGCGAGRGCVCSGGRGCVCVKGEMRGGGRRTRHRSRGTGLLRARLQVQGAGNGLAQCARGGHKVPLQPSRHWGHARGLSGDCQPRRRLFSFYTCEVPSVVRPWCPSRGGAHAQTQEGTHGAPHPDRHGSAEQARAHYTLSPPSQAPVRLPPFLPSRSHADTSRARHTGTTRARRIPAHPAPTTHRHVKSPPHTPRASRSLAPPPRPRPARGRRR